MKLEGTVFGDIYLKPFTVSLQEDPEQFEIEVKLKILYFYNLFLLYFVGVYFIFHCVICKRFLRVTVPYLLKIMYSEKFRPLFLVLVKMSKTVIFLRIFSQNENEQFC